MLRQKIRYERQAFNSQSAAALMLDARLEIINLYALASKAGSRQIIAIYETDYVFVGEPFDKSTILDYYTNHVRIGT